nr:hypothetical protein [Deinococcus hopiensis]
MAELSRHAIPSVRQDHAEGDVFAYPVQFLECQRPFGLWLLVFHWNTSSLETRRIAGPVLWQEEPEGQGNRDLVLG